MADYWIAELFPPTFEFSVQDLVLKNQQSDKQQGFSSRDDEVRNKYDLYERVFTEMDDKKTANGSKNKIDLSLYEDTDSQEIEELSKLDAKKFVSKEPQDCIWSKKELILLRKYFQKSKLQNIQLAAMLQDSNRQVDEWKSKFHSQLESSQVLQEKLMQVTKQHKMLKISFKAMKEDLKRYHIKLKKERESVKELQTERSELSTELVNVKRELSKESFQKEKSQRLLEKKEEEIESLIADSITLLKQQYLLKITALKNEISTLNQELRREKDENRLNKKALNKLQMYFADLQCKQLENEAFSGSCQNLLSVVDIDYFST